MLLLIISFLLIQDSHLSTIKNVVCKEDFTDVGNTCLYISPLSEYSKTWSEASESCKKLNGHLFTIPSRGQFVHQLSAYINERSLNCYNDGTCVSGRWVNSPQHNILSDCPVLDSFTTEINRYPCRSHIFPYICELNNPSAVDSTYSCNCGVNAVCINSTTHGYCECRSGYIGRPRLHCYDYADIFSTILLFIFVTTIFYITITRKNKARRARSARYMPRHYPPTISVVQPTNTANGLLQGITSSA